jgi:hypothetical protein
MADGTLIEDETPEAVDPIEPEVEEAAVEPEAEEGEVVVTFGDEQPPEPDEPANWVNELRKRERQAQKELRELRQQVAQMQPKEPELVKPTLEACEYDADKFADALLDWGKKKAKQDEIAAQRQAEATSQQEAFVARQTQYAEGKKAIRADDFDDAEAVVLETLSEVQQGILLVAADRPVEMVLALGRNSAKAKELAAIKDPIAFAAKLETTMNVTRKPPAPESRVTGASAPITGSASARNLEKLQEQARASGDYTAYRAEKKRLEGLKIAKP